MLISSSVFTFGICPNSASEADDFQARQEAELDRLLRERIGAGCLRDYIASATIGSSAQCG